MCKNLIVTLLCLGLLACGSNIKPYSSNAGKNMVVNTKTDPDVSAAIDIFHVDEKCQLSYQGTVDLEASRTKLGLQNNRSHYLVVSFSSSSFWAGRSSSMSQEIAITPSGKFNYILDLSYLDNIYNVELKQKSLRSKKISVVESTQLKQCMTK